MFDIGWQELFLVALVTIIVVGPKELPRVLRTVTLWVRKVRGMAREFQDGLDELAREADIDELRRDIEQSATGDLEGEIKETIDPGGELEDSIQEIGGAIKDDPLADEPDEATKPAAEAVPVEEPAAEPVDKKAGGAA